ncbi:MAG: hypothetical protein HY696_12720 [Deltaproteobacteria bacterium]|nr:hypothetical protein [Deltaproteobacteria bacterium]
MKRVMTRGVGSAALSVLLAVFLLSDVAAAKGRRKVRVAPSAAPPVEAVSPAPPAEPITPTPPPGPFSLPTYEVVISPISPTRGKYLERLFPLVHEALPMLWPDYPWDQLEVPPLATTQPVFNFGEQKHFKRLLELWDQRPEPNPTLLEVKKFLRADLLHVLARSGDGTRWSAVRDAYLAALETYPSSVYAVSASYHLALVLLQLRDYHGAVTLAQRQEARWEADPKWAMPFRSLLMEAYYRRGRYVRAEDYLWELARATLRREDLTPHLALRYGDSLFWQARYEEAVVWYEKVRELLEAATTEAGAVSRLYYAESLFQLGKWDLAQPQFAALEKQTNLRMPNQLLKFRLVECDIESGVPATIALQRLRSIVALDDRSEVALVAEMAWIRMVLRSGLHEHFADAQLKLQAIERSKPGRRLSDELYLLGALLDWRGGSIASAVERLRGFFLHVSHRTDTRLVAAASDFTSLLLSDLAAVYFKREDRAGFLMLCHELRYAIQRSNYKLYPLIWVARAYVETGMAGSAARLYQRLVMELELTPAQRDFTLLQLAHTYSQLGEIALAGKALAVVSQVPQDPLSQHLYYLLRATQFVAAQQYDACVSELEQLMKGGVRGDEIHTVALQASICARKAKRFPDALKFIGMVADEHANILRNNLSPQLQRWQTQALFEKINVLAAMGSATDAVRLFEQTQTMIPPVVPPLETVFSAVQSYRQLGDPDRGAALWKQYGGNASTVPDDIRDQYAKLLELLGQTELLPVAPGLALQ